MLFNSTTFAVFLVVVFATYWIVGTRHRSRQNLLLLVASYVFYGWWDWRFLSLIAASSAVDYFVGLALGREDGPRRRRALLGVSLFVNLGMLGFFKYYDFFAASAAELLETLGFHADPFTLGIVLPVGISFYTLQTLSYTIDIYRRRIEPTHDALSFFAFVAFFPQLVAGPIERAAHLLPQFERDRTFHYAWAVSGLRLMLWGYLKKMVIADQLAPFVELVFASPEQVGGLAIVAGALGFTIQVYGDFSGYSDIAIGCARLFGFDLSPNFQTPLLSRSLRDFWSRWHISLYSWFRDYVYIVLGGSRVTEARWIFNIFLTFLISGLWHGAAWNFVLWGAVTGVLVAVEAVVRRHWPKLGLPALLGIPVTVGLFVFTMLIFRARSVGDTLTLIGNLFAPSTLSFEDLARQAWSAPTFGLYVALSVVLLFVLDVLIGRADVNRLFRPLPRPLRWAFAYALVLWILLLGWFGSSPQFVYFQF